jgi:hypothetical protein
MTLAFFGSDGSDDPAALAALRRTKILKRVALFCAAALLVSLLSMTYGLDLSAGLF